eukprot:TRINITY_DN34394_c0_g1_i1.p1 TRINITY_DN34394_c0_g1~~TRINITY_DN34394_c0_g1_i1.p1  ORF type:complete len:387 (-),score=32.73 TRINITY_DN34394_c0_g1_i1:72-1232(-)
MASAVERAFLARFQGSADARRVDLVSKYLQALRRGTFEHGTPDFDAKWSAEKAPAVASSALLSMLRCESSERTKARVVTDEALFNVVALLGRLLEELHRWDFFSNPRLQASIAFTDLTHIVFKLLVSTACVYCVPQDFRVHPLLLATKDLFNKPQAWLWRELAAFLFLPPVSWWFRSRSAFIHQDRDADGRVRGIQVVKSDLADYPHGSGSQGWLRVNGVLVDADADYRKTVKKNLHWLANGRNVAIPDDVPIDISILVTGVFRRLQCGIPVLLVGDLVSSVDVRITQLISTLLGVGSRAIALNELSEEVGRPVGTDSLSDSFPELLVLVRSSPSGTSVDEKQVELLEKTLALGSWRLASMPYSPSCALDLPLKIPRSLRDLVVMC